MKKWLIIFSLICGVSFMVSAAIAGQVYYKELNTYTDYSKQELNIDALQSIYIQSQIPIQIEITEGKPYVEFNQSFIDLLGMAPEFELKIKTKEDSTYIDLEQIKETTIYLGVQEDKASLTVYLPQKAYDTIQIQNNGHTYYGRKGKHNINLENIDAKNIDIDVAYSEINLKGSYEQILAHIDSGTLEIHSNQPAQLEVEGNVKTHLIGQYESINIHDIQNKEIYIDSEIPAYVEIQSNHSNIKLRGKYDKINLEGYSNTIDAQSDSTCKVIIENEDGYTNLSGAFEEIVIDDGEGSSINIQTTVIPECIKILGYITDPISLTLPSNIKGFEVRYLGDHQYEERNKLLSEFSVVEGISPKGEKIYTYGDGSISIAIDANSNFKLEIIDGGYSSELQ